MKTKKYVFATAIAIALLAVACSDTGNDNPEPPGAKKGNATLEIVLAGNNGTRATVDDADQADLLAEESAVKKYAVYVFDDGGLIEKKEEFLGTVIPAQVTGLTEGDKTIVVLTNMDAFPDVTNYAGLTVTPSIELEDEINNVATKGFVMSGKATPTLTSGATNNVTVTVDRVVSKIKLGTIAFDNQLATGHDASKLTLSGVAIMQAPSHAAYNPDSVGNSTTYWGGIPGTTSTVIKTFLHEDIEFDGSTPGSFSHNNIYFYVLPNGLSEDKATLLTLIGEYQGQGLRYFPFRINPQDDSGNPRKGLIKRNHEYTVNVTFKRPGYGVDDPEKPLDPAIANVTVEVKDWETVTNNVSW